MVNGKEDPLERKESVVALYLMGNVPEKISEKLAMPVKNVRSDLRNMGIKVFEDHSKTEEQIIIEARQEIELINQELWGMYINSKTAEQKLKIIAELRELISKKTDTVRKEPIVYSVPNSSGEKNLWKNVKENFFDSKKGVNETTQIEILDEVKTKAPLSKIEFVDLPSEKSCAVFVERQNLIEETLLNREEVPTKSYVYSPGFRDECEKDNEKLEIVDLSEHFKCVLKDIKNIPKPKKEEKTKKERTIEDRIVEFERNRKQR